MKSRLWVLMLFVLELSSAQAFHTTIHDLGSTPADLHVIGDYVTTAPADFGESLGTSVVAGDFNDDGVDDLLLGASGPLGLSGSSNSAYVIFGSAALAGTIDPVASAADFQVIAPINGDSDLGSSVDAADVNGDGIDDMLLGSSNQTYVVFGKQGLGGVLDLALESADLTLLGASLPAHADVNGDGIADLLLSEPEASAPGRGLAGLVYVVFGDASLSGELDLVVSADFTVIGERILDLLHSRGGGDVTGDGIDDLIMSASTIEGTRAWAGEIYVVSGSPDLAGTLDLSVDTADFQVLGAADDNLQTWGAADVNGDGVADLLMGAPSTVGDVPGMAYVIFGSDTLNGTRDLALEPADYTVLGAESHDRIGTSFAAADLNEDGIEDLLLGAWGLTAAGKVYGVFGATDLGGVRDLASVPADFQVLGADDGDRLGIITGAGGIAEGSAIGSGDFNGDGINDLLVGASNADGEDNAKDGVGEVYVLFGPAPTGFAVGGAVTGMIPQTIRCENKETRQRVSVPLPDDGRWNCEEAGLLFDPGDRIKQRVTGIADGTASVGGTVTGVSGIKARCDNISTGRRVFVDLNGGNAWDCEEAGLRVRTGDSIIQSVLGTADQITPPDSQTVSIDIKPGDDSNRINLVKDTAVSVAILTDSGFDALEVDPSSVRFGADQGSAFVYRSEDSDGDGDIDLRLRFRLNETGIACGDTEATLTGVTFGGQQITGTDSIEVICN